MLELHQQPRLAHEAVRLQRVLGELGAQHLQGDLAAVGLVDRREHAPDPAFAELLTHFVAGQHRPRATFGASATVPTAPRCTGPLHEELSGRTGCQRIARGLGGHETLVHEHREQLHRGDHGVPGWATRSTSGFRARNVKSS
jgi:hypothetical protein